MSFNHPQLRGAVEALQYQLAAHQQAGRPLRCMACNTVKRVRPSWKVAGYMPRTHTHPPIAYVICGLCSASPTQIKRAMLTIETMSREAAEQYGSAHPPQRRHPTGGEPPDALGNADLNF